MSLELTMSWEGLDELRAWLDEAIPGAFEEAAVEALNRAGDDGANRAAQIVPVDTGALQRSIRREPDAHVEGDEFVVGVSAGDGGVSNPRTGREVDYAGYVEFGTSRARAQPYLRPALMEAAEQIPELFAEAVEARMR
jgi:HK97 gp10 family phage protein